MRKISSFPLLQCLWSVDAKNYMDVFNAYFEKFKQFLVKYYLLNTAKRDQTPIRVQVQSGPPSTRSALPAANSHLRFSCKLKDAKEEEQAVPYYCSKVQGIAIEKKLDTAITLIRSMNICLPKQLNKVRCSHYLSW